MNSYYASYIGTSETERNAMLKEIGISSVDELFTDIPKQLLLSENLNIPGPYSEQELGKLFAKIAAKNLDPNKSAVFLGGGIKQQYIPAAIEELMRRGELYTSYTPYQPEISQGLLQLIYEYQSMVAELLDMEVVNASMYDWGSAMGESLLIMKRISRKNKVFIAEPISPKRLEVARVYIKNLSVEIEVIPSVDGHIDFQKLEKIFETEAELEKNKRSIAGVYFEVPTFYGTIPDYPETICNIVHEAKALVTVGVDPISLGILQPPGSYGADIVVGEGQLLGNGISSGGPLLGILATRYNRKWIKELPGRLIGSTHEMGSSNSGYCITLQTREQHIRRERATSNICTNQSITAVNAAIYLAMLGKAGIKELAQILVDKAHYLGDELKQLDNCSGPIFEPYFSEFVVSFDGITHQDLEEKCLQRNLVPGIPIDREGCFRLLSVTELHDKQDLDSFITNLREVLL